MSARDHAVNPAMAPTIPAGARARNGQLPAKAGAGDVACRPTPDEINATEQAPAPDRWKFQTLRDAFAPRPPVEWLVKGVFRAGSLNVAYGAPGTLKSMLMIDALLSVATGTPWLPPMPNTGGAAIPTTKAPVMLVDFDSGLSRSSERIEALAKARRLSAESDAQISYVSFPTPWLIASDRASVTQFAYEVTERRARMVVIDNLGNITGGIDENSSEMVSVMGNLRWLTEHTGACVVLIHHERKGQGEARKGGDALRGHSSINAALDLALLVEREGDSRIVNLRSTKTRDTDVVPFGAEFNFQHKTEAGREKELDTAWFWGMHDSADDGSDKAVETAIMDACFNAGKTGLNGSQLVAAVQTAQPHAGKNRIRMLADSLVTRKKLISTKGERNAKTYVCP